MNIQNSILDNWQNIQFNSASCYLLAVGPRNVVPCIFCAPYQYQIYFTASYRAIFEHLASLLTLEEVCVGL